MQHYSADFPAAVYQHPDYMDAALRCHAAFMIKYLKSIVTYVQLFNLLEATLAPRRPLKTMISPESGSSVFANVPVESGEILSLTVPKLSGGPVFIVDNEFEVARSDVAAVEAHAGDFNFPGRTARIYGMVFQVLSYHIGVIAAVQTKPCKDTPTVIKDGKDPVRRKDVLMAEAAPTRDADGRALDDFGTSLLTGALEKNCRLLDVLLQRLFDCSIHQRWIPSLFM